MAVGRDGDVCEDADRPDAGALLRWYDRHRRTMPWRARPGEQADPYHVWLSEVMLQQTTVATVGPYFERFLARFPTVSHLAEAPGDAVMEAWAGLGYYARARNLHACAQRVAALGGFPRDLEGLRALPGIGPYTAAAVACIAFGAPVVPVDGNVERVTARIFAIDTPLPAAKPLLARAAARLGADPLARRRPSDFAQALFDLGATICSPRKPDCAACPWRSACQGHERGGVEQLPVKPARKVRPVRHGACFWLQDADGHVALRRRPPRGLLGGMLELPGTAWRAHPWSLVEARQAAPQCADWRHAGVVEHGFTHFVLRLEVCWARVATLDPPVARYPVAALATLALPSVVRKCVALLPSWLTSADSPEVNLPVP